MELVSRYEVVKKDFNSERREINSVSDFMRLYLKILQLAFLYQFIDERQRDLIAGNILNSIKKVSYENDIVVSNYVYIISMRFLTMSNYDCWELLRNVTSVDEAEKFILDTRDWFEKRVKFDLTLTNVGFEKSLELNNKFILESWNYCLKTLKLISGCLTEETKCELKSLHNSGLETSYLTIHQKDAIIFLEKLENYIKNFGIEISIMNKLDAKTLFREIAEERRNIEIQKSPEIIEAQKKYDEALEKYEFEKENFDKKSKNISFDEKEYSNYDFVKSILNLNEDEFEDVFLKFAKLNSDLDEDDFEIAYDEFLNSFVYTDEDSYIEKLFEFAKSISNLNEKEFEDAFLEFAKSISKLDEGEFETAFDEYWKNAEDSNDDFVIIEENSFTELIKLQEEVLNRRKILDDLEDSKSTFKDYMYTIADDITLLDLLNEYAIFILAKEGKIIYPENLFVKYKIFLNLSIDSVIRIFIDNEAKKLSLTTEELEYLNN